MDRSWPGTLGALLRRQFDRSPEGVLRELLAVAPDCLDVDLTFLGERSELEAPGPAIVGGDMAGGSRGARDRRLLAFLARLIVRQLTRWEEEAAARRRDRTAIEGFLERPGALRVVFQPIVDLRRAVPVGYEALARFDASPPRPDHWFAAAATLGMGIPLELAAIRRALVHWSDPPPGAWIALNASADMLSSPELTALLGLYPHRDRLVFELTEHVLEDHAALGPALARLRKWGCRVAVDDAGAGFASLERLLALPADIIKLEGRLTAGVHGDPARRALAAAMVAFARETGADLVAEGIESQADLDTLLALGIAYGQGYYLGRPGPLPR